MKYIAIAGLLLFAGCQITLGLKYPWLDRALEEKEEVTQCEKDDKVCREENETYKLLRGKT